MSRPISEFQFDAVAGAIPLQPGRRIAVLALTATSLHGSPLDRARSHTSVTLRFESLGFKSHRGVDRAGVEGPRPERFPKGQPLSPRQKFSSRWP
jgi:hypothetical protein